MRSAARPSERLSAPITAVDDTPSLVRALRAVAWAPPLPLEVLAPPLAPGSRLDEFEVLGVIGKGGMSVVYRARDTQLDREVAIKVLSPAWTGSAAPTDALLEREARATARLRHPRIVTIHRVGRHAGRLYLVLELLEGETLAARLQRGRLGEVEALAIGLQLCDALAHAHASGIVHRDIKPANVFVETGGAVKVLDFGLSGLALEPHHGSTGPDRAQESIGAWAGTPAYMAPEQWHGDAVDERTDVYAAGVVLHELLTGRLPARQRWLRPSEAPARPKRVSPARARLDQIVGRAMAGNPDARFADAGALASALRATLAAARRRRLLWRLARMLVPALFLVAVAAVSARTYHRHAPMPDLSGIWQADPYGKGRATLRRVADDTYEWEHRKRPIRVGPDTYYNRGTLRVRRDRGGVLLEGWLADVPGWCCGNVGFLRLEVEGPNSLRVARSTWGKRHDDYDTAHAPYWFRRQTGP